MQHSRRHTLALAAACLLFLIPSLLTRGLWKPDEPRYAQVSREMLETGEWIVPHLNGATYAHKPPLVFWFGAVARALGAGANGTRLASMLAAVGTVLLLFDLGRRWHSARTGLLAAVVLVTCVEYGWMARNGGLDASLTFLTTLAVWGFAVGGRALLLLYVAAGLSVLVKGPVGLIFIALGIAALRFASVPVGARGLRHLLWGIPLMLTLIAAWVVPACVRAGEAYTNELLFTQIAGRTVDSWSHARPVYHYLPQLPVLFALWIVMAVPATSVVWRRRREDPAAFAMLLWCVAALVVFSLISGKRARYLLPIFPAFALFTARGIEAGYLAVLDRTRSLRMRRAAMVQAWIGVGIAVALLLVCAFGGLVLDRFADSHPVTVEQLRGYWDGPWKWLAMVGFGAVAATSYRARKAARAFDAPRAIAALALSSLLLWLVVDIFMIPAIDRLKSPRDVTRAIDQQFPPDGKWELRAYLDFHHAAFSIYSERLTWDIEHDVDHAVAFLEGGPARALMTSERDLRRNPPGDERTLYDVLSPDWRVSVLGRVGSNLMLVVSNGELDGLPPWSARLRK